MTDLSRLKVSLTKHNAHKVAVLLRKYKAADVLAKLDDVHAEAAQAWKNLSVSASDILPPVWEKVQTLGPDAIDALVLVAIIFSHEDLIKAFSEASDRKGFAGRVERDNQLDGKSYTNTVRIIDQLGYADKIEKSGVTFNLRGMFEIAGLGPLVLELLELKLIEAHWSKENSPADEAVRLGFEKVFGITAPELKAWLTKGVQPTGAGSTLLTKDQEYFESETEGEQGNKFEFRAGHTDRDVGPVERSASRKSMAGQQHNDIQNKLYTYLKDKLGASSVGTELDTGSGTSIDVVTQHEGKITFYEIKTGQSVRACIRQALPQLLEYAFFPEDQRAHELIVISHLAATPDATRYLNHLKKKFGLPLTYMQFDLETNTLV